MRQRNPRLSQDDVAADIIALWTQETPTAPGPERLKKFISELEHAGVIPLRVGRKTAIMPD
jgi:hypothetical protein